jgi:hypothetical protein
MAAAISIWASGCPEKKEAPKSAADEELTIVVQADKSRIAAEEAALEDHRKTIEEEREQLRREMEKLGASRGEKSDPTGSEEMQQLLNRAVRLVQEQGEEATKREALAKERDGLLAKVLAGDPASKPAPAAAPAPSAELTHLTAQVAGREKDLAGRERMIADREKTTSERESVLSDREKVLAEREKDLASREAAFAQRESTCRASPKRADRSEELTRAGVEKAYRELLAAMEAKGVLASDLPAAKQKKLAEAAQYRSGDLSNAMGAVEATGAAVESLAIDGEFVTRKAKWVNRLQEKSSADAKTREEVSRLLKEVTQAFSDGRYSEANRSLNNIVSLFEKGATR